MDTGESLKVRRFPLLLVAAIAAATFGPYLIGSVRTEQLAVYGAGALLLPLTFIHVRPYLPVFLSWLTIIVVALIGLIPPTAHDVIKPGNALSSLDNLALPVAVMLVVWAIVPADMVRPVLRAVAVVIVCGAAANGVLGIIATSTDISAYMRPFWSGSAGETTAERAAQLGRFSGIFNQPAEAGVVYGLAGLLAVWAFRRKPKIMLLLLTLISIGGMLCISKVFILGGLPLILIYLWLSRSGAGKLGVILGAAALTAGVVQTGLFQQWTGMNFLARLFAPAENHGFIEFYSAGRWNEDAGMVDLLDSVMRASPLTGFGIQGLEGIPYDSAWTEVAVLAGFMGVVLLAAVYLALISMARKIADGELRVLATFITVFLLGASLGIPSLTVNRASTVVWVVLSLLCTAALQSRREAAQTRAASALASSRQR